MLVAIDWSHVKQLTTYDGKEVRVENVDDIINRVQKRLSKGAGDESQVAIKSGGVFQSPACVIERTSPLSLVYKLVSHGIEVYLIDTCITFATRTINEIKKTDANDAKIIWQEATNGAKLELITLNELCSQSLIWGLLLEQLPSCSQSQNLLLGGIVNVF